MLAGNAAYSPFAFESIATVTATTNVTSLTFSGIPQTYKHLQIRGISRRDTGVNHVAAVQFNSDTGNNYWFHGISGDGTTANAPYVSIYQPQIQMYYANGSTSQTNQFGAGIIDIHDYTSNKRKTAKGIGVCANTSNNGRITSYSGVWNNTAAITSITVNFAGDTAVAGTTFSLYGIKA